LGLFLKPLDFVNLLVQNRDFRLDVGIAAGLELDALGKDAVHNRNYESAQNDGEHRHDHELPLLRATALGTVRE
jgi:hypothetical protein